MKQLRRTVEELYHLGTIVRDDQEIPVHIQYKSNKGQAGEFEQVDFVNIDTSYFSSLDGYHSIIKQTNFETGRTGHTSPGTYEPDVRELLEQLPSYVKEVLQI